MGRNSHVNSKVLVFAKDVDNQGTKLKDVTGHITATSTETPRQLAKIITGRPSLEKSRMAEAIL
jgi:hypothetical protein